MLTFALDDGQELEEVRPQPKVRDVPRPLQLASSLSNLRYLMWVYSCFLGVQTMISYMRYGFSP